MKKIIFVCTGNTCRSPMAEKLGQMMAQEKQLEILILSRGLSVSIEEGAHERAIIAMKAYGQDLLTHRSTQFRKSDCLGEPLILAMTLQHKKAIQTLYPEMKDNIFTLKEYAGESGDVHDPFGRPQVVYDQCAQEMSALLFRIFDKLQEELV
ncbi:MAG: low molecular weight protein arginine phosphatase [Vallitaleaceae bacterium]|nr:low molecular weight protein arginine phosphatase [Vallitaleaceae bacterium]